MNLSGGFRCACALALCYGVAAETAAAGDNLIEAITEGKVDFFGRLRYEHVDDEQGGVEDADAFTLRPSGTSFASRRLVARPHGPHLAARRGLGA